VTTLGAEMAQRHVPGGLAGPAIAVAGDAGMA
jgi:hypothetical protein